MQKRTLEHLPALDGLRAVAIVAVLFSHSATQLFGESGVFQNRILSTIASHGRLGVDLFFAISGFLITHRLLAEVQATGHISLKSFYIRRIFRILPPYMLYLIVIVLLSMCGKVTVRAWEIGSSLLFLRNYFMSWTTGGESTNHFWSLAVEEHFYLLWPILLILLRPKRSLWGVPLLALLIHAWLSFDMRYHVFSRFLPDAGTLFRTDTRLDALLWGCFSALVYPRVQEYIGRVAWRGTLFQAALPLFLILVIVLHAPFLHLWLALIFPSIVISTVTRSETILGQFLDSPLPSWLGKMSYSLYIWQTLFLQCDGVSQSLSHSAGGLSRLYYWIIDIVSIIVVGSISYYLVERTMISVGRKLATRVIERSGLSSA